MIKSLKKNDIRTTPFTAAKKWNPQNKLHKDLILWQSGSVSGSLSLTFKEYNDGTVAPYTYISSAIALQQQQDDFLRFREGVNLSGSISPTGSFYYDPVLSEKNLDGTYKTVLYATTKHLFYKESQDPSKIFGLESLDSSNVNRSLPNKISTFNIPQNKFGEKVIPKSVVITHEIQGQTYNVVDDGNSNLVVSDKTFINNQDANVDKIPANIILNDVTSNVYTGNPFVITATTKPLNLAYIVTYNGSTTPPINAGTYTVVATIDDNFYAASTTSTFIIQKAAATITISNSSPIYDGNPKSVTVVSVPSTLNRTVTYNGSTTPPTNAGTYDVVVTINDINYQGTKTDTLTVVPQTLTITTQCPSKTYGDEDFTIPVNTVSDGAISYASNNGTAKIVNGKIRITGVGTLNITITQAAAGNYSAASVICSSTTVSPKPLTVTGITAADKAQDATTTATLNPSNKKLQGVIINPTNLISETPDNVILGGTAAGVFSDASPGEGKTVTISGLSISGTDASKYTLVQPTATAAIKVSSANGTITMPNATVTYNGNPQPLDVSISDINIPIKITYSVNNTILRVDRLYRNQLTKLSGNDYPKDIGASCNVTAELDTTVSTEILYTVTTVKATLNITSITGVVTFGPNIFYFDGKPKPVQILSTSPAGKEMIITYTGPNPGSPYTYGQVLPSATGTYYVNVKFKDNNIVYNNTVTLSIKQIPSSPPGKISKGDDSPQDQKNIIDFSTSTGLVNFKYSVVSGKRFTIEYPLNSGDLVHDSGVLSVNNLAQDVNISFNKDKTGIDLNTGQNNDKCLITVYSPTNDSPWNYSISDVGVTAPNLLPPPLPTTTQPTIADLPALTIEINSSFPTQGPESLNGSKLVELESQLGVLEKNGTLTLYELSSIASVLDSNKTQPFTLNTPKTLTAGGTNIKVTVTYTQNANNTTIKLLYTRLTDSLDVPTTDNPGVVDCHYYKYTGTLMSFDISVAKSQLKSQIDSDTFKNIVNGSKQQNLLKGLVDYAVTGKDYDIIRFRFQNGKVDVYDRNINGVETARELFTTNIDAGGESEGLIYINSANQIVEIVYPLICNLGNIGT
jgi:hypothetical protein